MELFTQFANLDIASAPSDMYYWVEPLEPYLACFRYANKKNGCVGFFDRNDSNLITDGDVTVYMGPQSKRICEVFQDSFDVKVFRSKDLRR